MFSYDDLLNEIKDREEKTLEILDEILETIDILNNAEDMNAIKKSLQDLKTGKIFPLKISEDTGNKKINSLYVLKCTETFMEQLIKITGNTKSEVIAALEVLKTNPSSPRTLHGNLKELRRLQVNSKAVIYTIKDDIKTVVVLTFTTIRHALSI